MPQHQGRHFPSANAEDSFVIEVIENAACIIHCNAGNAQPSFAEPGLVLHLFADRNRPLE